MSTKTDDKVTAVKKDVTSENALRLLVSILESRGVLKAHQVAEILKEIK